MGTDFEEIYNLALITIRDYKIDKWAVKDYNIFLNYMQGILIRSIPKFTGCLKSLKYRLNISVVIEGVPTIKSFFEEKLTNLEQSILADSMVNTWFFSGINDVTEVNLSLQGRDKKTHSASQNLKEKSEYYDRLNERLSQSINDYQLEGDNFDVIFGI